MATPLKVAVAGLGTVGARVVGLLDEESALLERRCGRSVVVTAISARDRNKDRGMDLERYQWFDDPRELAVESDADVIIEAIGGEGGIARTVCERALGAGRHLITANKALLAHRGDALFDLAEEKGRNLGFEAAVAGGVPVIKTLKEGLAANQITEIYGILNGTSNYILSRMDQSGEDFDAILRQAQRLGYAEADPTLDINGTDSGHKLALLTSIAFGCPIRYDSENVVGIEGITLDDILFAEDLGYRIRLLGVAKLWLKGVEQRVHPCLLPSDSPLAAVQDAYNAVIFKGGAIDRVMMVGRGAGGGPTASSVVADLIDIACSHNRVRTICRPLPIIPLKARIGAYYVRLLVRDEVGVLASIAEVFSRLTVSIEQFIQRKSAPGEYVPVVLTTHVTKESDILQGLEIIDTLETVKDYCLIRIEDL